MARRRTSGWDPASLLRDTAPRWIGPHHFPASVLELLAHAHDYGGGVTGTGTKRAVVLRAQALGLVVVTDRGTTDEGRQAIACRLLPGAAIANLAHRCSDALRKAHELATAEGRRYAGLHWRLVPYRPEPREWPGAHACPACGCVAGRPCTVVLPDGCGEGSCVPAGVYGLHTCSACGP